jgi:hypothetical protein
MARAKKEVRLRKPAHRAAQVRAVDGENLELAVIDVSDPTGSFGGFTGPGIDIRIAVRSETSLPRWELFDGAQRDPRFVLLIASDWREQVSNNGDGERNAGDPIEKEANLEKQTAPRRSGFKTH